MCYVPGGVEERTKYRAWPNKGLQLAFMGSGAVAVASCTERGNMVYGLCVMKDTIL